MIRIILILFFALACQKVESSAVAKVSQAAKKIVVCSQNLARLGSNKNEMQEQLNYLVDRMLTANCSIVALQEIAQDSPGALGQLAQELSKRTGRKYEYLIGKSMDKYITNGYLVASDLGKVKSFKSYWNKSLPRLYPYGPSRGFLRGPAELNIELYEPFRFSNKKNLNIINIHFKSKRDGWKDPAKMNFEVERVESAEAVRQIALNQSAKDTMLIVIGDRNNGKDTASDEVLEGRVELADLSEGGACQLTKNEVALCRNTRNPALLGLFGLRLERYPDKFPKGSHKYRGKEHLLDEAFIRPQDLGLVTRNDKSLSIGYVGEYFKGSDHKLLFLELGNVD